MKKFVLLLITVSILVAISAFTFIMTSSGDPGYSGSPVDGATCNSCHTLNAGQTPTVTITATPAFGSGNTYVPSGTYTISVVATGTVRYGMDLEILNGTSPSSTDAGTFGTAVTLNCTKAVSAAVTTVYNNSSSTSGTFSFRWTAPVSGTAYLYCCVLGADGNGSPTNDGQAQANLTLAQATTVTVSKTDILCFGMNNGSATATPSGGTFPYTYLWTGGATTSAISNLAAGNYTVTVTDAVAATATGIATIIQPAVLSGSISGNTAICNGQSTTLTCNVSGGLSPYVYSWNTGHTIPAVSVSPTANTTYSAVVTDVNGCTKQAIATVTVNATTSAPTVTGGGAHCSGASLGLTASLITSATYSWSGPNSFTSAVRIPNISNITSAASGTYSVVATVAGCQPSPAGTVSITVNQSPAAITASSNSPVNSGQTISLTASTIAGATYSWTGPNSFTSALQNPTISNATLANSTLQSIYSVQALLNGCGSNSPGVSVVVNNTNTVSLSFSQTSSTCGNFDGTATATLSGGTSPYTYVWDANAGNQTTQIASGLSAGIYSVTVTDATFSQATGSTIVNNTGMSVSTGGNITLCPGNSTTLNALVSGGTGPYTYSWSSATWLSNPNISNPVANPMGTTDYIVSVTDAIGCIALSTINIYVPPLATGISPSVNSPVCSGKILHFYADTVMVGPGATYNWNGPNGFTSTAANPYITSVTTAASGTYTMVITRSGCLIISGTVGPSGGVVVNQTPTAPTASSSSPVNAGQTLSLTASSTGTTYQWIGPNTYTSTIQNPIITGVATVASGTYSVTTSANGCTSPAGTTSVTVNTAPSVSVTVSTTSVSCTGNCNGSATANPTSGISPYTYSWNSGATTQSSSNLCSGSFTVTVTDALGSTATAVATILQPAAIAVTITPASVSCNGSNNGSATSNVLGGTTPYTYNWYNGQSTIAATGLGAATYSFTVTDNQGCILTTTTTISQPSILTANASVSLPISCHASCDGSVTANPAGGTLPYSYLWAPGSITAQSMGALCPNMYSVTITDANGCISNSSVSLLQPAVLSATVAKTDLTCNGQCNGTATATAVGGTTPYSYYWNNGENVQTAIALCAGTYNVDVTDNHGCTVRDTIVVSQPLPVPITISTTPPTCGAINGSVTAVVSGAGAVPPFRVLWNTGDTNFTINNLGAGIYRANVKDGHGCASFSDAFINNSNGPVVSAGTIKDVSCFGLSDGSIDITVTGTGPYKYKWSNGYTTQNISNLSYGPYEVVVSDASTCSASKSVFVNQPSSPLSSSTSAVKSSCPGNNGSTSVFVAGGTTPYTYQWSSGINAATASGLSSGNYSATVTDAHGCTILAMAAVSDITGPVVVADTIPAVDCGSTGFLALKPQDSTLIQGYQWNTGSTTQNLSNVSPGNYGVVVTDNSGCKSSLLVPVKPALPPLKPICLVTVDTLTQLNLIVWEKPLSAFIDGFNIYRESSQNGIYQKVGYVPYSHQSTFYDSITNPSDRWAKYKISMNDVCGKEGPFSPEHKTIHFSIQSSTIDKTYLIWDEYIGSAFSYYHIFRKAKAHGAWTLIDSVPSTLTVYCDSLFPQSGDTLFYLIDVTHAGGDCNATIKGGPTPYATTVKGSKSNSDARLTTLVTFVAANAFDNTLVVYPNPSKGTFTVQSTKSKVKELNVYNMFGELVYKTLVNNSHKTEVSIPGIANGIYQVHVVTDTGETNRKIFIAR